jgi:hypothetical protein
MNSAHKRRQFLHGIDSVLGTAALQSLLRAEDAALANPLAPPGLGASFFPNPLEPHAS